MIDYRAANITLSLVTKNSIELSREITCFDLDMKANQICILRFSFNSFWTQKNWAAPGERVRWKRLGGCMDRRCNLKFILTVFSKVSFFLQAKLALLLWINHEIKKQDLLQLEECQPFFLIFGSLFDKICPPGWFTSIRHLFALYLGPCYMYKLPLPVLSNAP